MSESGPVFLPCRLVLNANFAIKRKGWLILHRLEIDMNASTFWICRLGKDCSIVVEHYGENPSLSPWTFQFKGSHQAGAVKDLDLTPAAD